MLDYAEGARAHALRKAEVEHRNEHDDRAGDQQRERLVHDGAEHGDDAVDDEAEHGLLEQRCACADIARGNGCGVHAGDEPQQLAEQHADVVGDEDERRPGERRREMGGEDRPLLERQTAPKVPRAALDIGVKEVERGDEEVHEHHVLVPAGAGEHDEQREDGAAEVFEQADDRLQYAEDDSDRLHLAEDLFIIQPADERCLYFGFSHCAPPYMISLNL